jgi:hypothetical protein
MQRRFLVLMAMNPNGIIKKKLVKTKRESKKTHLRLLAAKSSMKGERRE